MQRFYDKTKRNPTTGCLEWTACTRGGYGLIKVDGKHVNAHRVAWELAYGPIPAGLWVLHRCDNPACVEPSHLFLGTPADNTRDAMTKRRLVNPPSPRGRGKLNPVAVRVIRYFHAKGVSQRKLARLHGVSKSTVGNVVHRKTWAHV